MKKFVSLFLALILVLALVPATLAEGETTVVTVAFDHSSGVKDLFYESAAVKNLKEKYGIEFQYTYYAEDQYALMLASGTLPDILTAHRQYISTIVDNNMALDLTPYLEQYPNLDGEIFKTSNEMSRLLLGGEEHKLYFLCPAVGAEYINGGDNLSWGFQVRWDYYKELGCPEIHNEDDYIRVLKDMVALHPTNEAGEKTYGIAEPSTFANWLLMGDAILDGGGVNPWVFSNTMYRTGWDDTVMYNGYTDEEHSSYWTAMRFFNKCWREGLLDPDSFTMTSAELDAKYAAQRYVGATVYCGGAMYNEAKKSDPNTLIGFVTLPTEATFVFANKLALSGNAPTNTIFINAKSENIEAALTVMNYFRDPETLTVYYNGEQGVAWDYDENGKPYMTDMAIASYIKNGRDSEEYIKDTGASYVLTEFKPVQDSWLDADGNAYALRESFSIREKLLNPLQKDYANYFGFATPSEYAMSVVNAGKTIDLIGDYGQAVACGMAETPMDIRRIADECFSICERALPDLVMAESDEAFAEAKAVVLSDLEDADEAIAWAWVEENFNAAKALVQPIYEAAIGEVKAKLGR